VAPILPLTGETDTIRLARTRSDHRAAAQFIALVAVDGVIAAEPRGFRGDKAQQGKCF
jgi:hypothetical protein